MKRRRWTRGKALETVIALKGIREGDEVLLQFDRKKRDLTPLSEDDRRRFVAYEEKQVPFIIGEANYNASCSGSGIFARHVRGAESNTGWGFFISEVVAWRPRRKP